MYVNDVSSEISIISNIKKSNLNHIKNLILNML
jgi:hypothetical protein